MGTVISNLKARFGVDNSDFKKGLKDGEKAVDDFKGAAGNILDDFASMFGVNMNAVNDAVGTANKSLSFMGKSFTAAKSSSEKFAVALKVLKFALVATGIGAIVIVLGSLIAYFTKSGEGADRFAKILSQFRSVVDTVITRLAVFGKGVYEISTGKFRQGWETMRGAFKGIGDEITNDWKEAGKLADAEDALEDREIALINSLEERKAKVAELRLLAKEEMEDQKKKLSLIQQAEALTRSVYGDQVSLEQERLRIMKEKLALQTSDPTDDQRREIAEQEAKINQLYREQAEQLKALNREKRTALAIVQQEVELEKAKANQMGVMAKSIANLKMPDFGDQTSKVLMPLNTIKKAVAEASIDMSTSIQDAFSSMAAGLGEFAGAMASGNAGFADFGKMIAGTFADMAISVGKIAIGAGMAVLGIKKSLMTMNPYLAIGAGIALVALGSAIKGSLSSVAGGGGAAAGGGSNSFTYDTRGSSAQTQPINLTITGELTASGQGLRLALNNENVRRGIAT